MKRLFCWFVVFVLVQCALFSFGHNTSESVAGKNKKQSKTRRSGASLPACDPKDRVHIPYTISNEFNELVFEAVRKSLDHYMDRTCLTFEWVDTLEDLAPRFPNGTGLTFSPSTYDYPYPAQRYFNDKELLVISLRLCETLYVQFDAVVARSVQQIFYGLGFLPEHKRMDRDSYVTIMEDNIYQGWAVEFEKKEEASTTFPYDYTSVGNFYPSDCAKNPSRLVIVSKTDKPVTRNFELSPGDAYKLNEKYCKQCKK